MINVLLSCIILVILSSISILFFTGRKQKQIKSNDIVKLYQEELEEKEFKPLYIANCFINTVDKPVDIIQLHKKTIEILIRVAEELDT